MNTQRIIFAVFTAILYGYILWQSETKAELIVYKATLITIAAMLGYWIDLLLFKNFRPTDLKQDYQKAIRDKQDVDRLIHDGKEMNGAEPVEAQNQIDYYKAVLPISIIRRAVIIAACVLAISLGI